MNDILNTKFDVVVIRGQEYLFTDERISKSELPDEIYKYEIRYSDEGYEPCEISEHILVNHYGTILSNKPITEWDEEMNGRHFIYLEFEDKPVYYEDENGEITDNPIDKNGEDNNPHYWPKENEWAILDECDMMTINEYLKGA